MNHHATHAIDREFFIQSDGGSFYRFDRSMYGLREKTCKKGVREKSEESDLAHSDPLDSEIYCIDYTSNIVKVY